MSCSSSCRTQDHESYGACLRSKNLKTNALNPDVLSAQKSADKTLDEYAKARSYGIQPSSTRTADVKRAVRISEQTGKAFQA
jgi:hypothetical protein